MSIFPSKPKSTKIGSKWFAKPKKSGSYQLVVENHPNSTISEAYRILQTNLNFKNIDRNFKCIALTSSVPGEGKSTNAANLAYTLAQSGKQVILVDADLRRPTIHKIFGLNMLEGLTSSIIENTDPLSLCKEVKDSGLKVLTSGPIPPNSSELLASNRMKAILQRLGEVSDYVIIDCPPVLGFNDTLALSSNVDGFLLVVGSSMVPKPALKNAKEQLDRVGSVLIGAIVNSLDLKESHGYGYYYYYYNSYYNRASN